MNTLTRICAVIVAGAIASGVAWTLAPTGDPTASATLRLDDQEVRWPFHDAVIQTQDALLQRDDIRALITRRSNLALDSIVTLNSEVPRNQTIFDITASASTESQAISIANGAVEALIERNIADRAAPIATEIEAVEIELGPLRADLAGQLRVIENTDAPEADRLVAQGRATAIAQRIGTLEVRLKELEIATTLVAPQLVEVAAAVPVNRERTRAVTAASAGAGIALLTAAVLGAAPAGRRRRSPGLRAA